MPGGSIGSGRRRSTTTNAAAAATPSTAAPTTVVMTPLSACTSAKVSPPSATVASAAPSRSRRVKNNLQVISGLLTIQAQTVAPELLEHYRDSQQRIRTMARVHEQFYTSG